MKFWIKNNNSTVRRIASFFLAMAVYISYMPHSFDSDSIIYLIGYKHAYDKTLYSGNVFLDDNSTSPRWIADKVYSLMMRVVGGSWETVGYILIFFALIILSFATVNFIYRCFARYDEVLTLLLAFLLVINHNELAGGNLFAIVSLSFGIATSFSLLGISYVIGKNKDFNKAGLLMGVAMISHVHEGIYGFVIVFIELLLDVFSKRKEMGLQLIKKNYIGIGAYFVAAVCVIVPSLLTDKAKITNKEFVEIYANFRHPHHLVPSSWGLENIVTSFFIIFSLAVIYTVVKIKCSKSKLKEFVPEIVFVLLFWCLMLFVSWFFVEIIPVAAVSTLFPLKYFKYAVLMSLIWGLKSVDILEEHEMRIASLWVLVFMFKTQDWPIILILSATGLICLFIVFYPSRIKSVRIVKYIIPICFVLLFGVNYISDIGIERKIIVLIGLGIYLVSQTELKKYREVAVAIAIISIVVCVLSGGNGYLYSMGTNGIVYSTPEEMLNNTLNQEFQDFCIEFHKLSEKNDMFFIDPMSTVVGGWLQIMAERNVYVLWKVIPSSKSKISEWYERYSNAISIMNQSSDEWADSLKDIGCKYVVVSFERYEDLDNSDNFVLEVTSQSDLYRIYRVI